ncbi:MAG: carboxypeptidase-like regulatory domain-containing protein [Planctomycetota bacterium]|nr:carboxypeptidase-like regulatory domain-containing protein [Planctomycetota bacterium]
MARKEVRMRNPRSLAWLVLALGAGCLLLWLLHEPTSAPTPPTGGSGLETPESGGEMRTTEGAPGADDPPQDSAAAAREAARLRGLRGSVADSRGASLPGARVRVHLVEPASLRGAPYPDAPALAEVETDHEGRYAFDTVPTGRWLRVIASAPGRASVGHLIPSAGAEVDFVLPTGGGLTLTLVDSEDRPVAEGRVQVQVGDTQALATSDASGEARFEALPPGVAAVRLTLSERGAVQAGPYLIRAGESVTHLVVVPRAVAIEGRVEAADTGVPIAGARVRIARPGQATQTETDAAGLFGPVPGGGVGERVLLAVDAPGYAPVLEPVVLRADGVQSALVRLSPAANWQGRVVDATGRAAVGATVGYSDDGVAAARDDLTTTSGPDGVFSLPPPPPPAPGRRVVLVARLGPALGALALRPGQVRPEPLTLTLLAGSVVTGVVRGPGGEALRGVTVRLTPAWDQVPRDHHPDEATSRLHAFNASSNEGLATATGVDGTWRILAVPAGPYRVHYTHAGGDRARREVLEVSGTSASAGVETLAGLSLSGRVTDARGLGLAGVEVIVTSAENPREDARTATDEHGDFAIAGLRAGPQRVRAVMPGRPVRLELIDLEGPGPHAVTLTLEEAARVQLRVFENKAPYRGLLTVVFGETGTGRASARRHSVRAVRGEAVIADAPPGTWTIEAFAPDGRRAQVRGVEIDAGRETPVTLDLEAGAELSGVVRTVDGQPVAGARLDLDQPATGARLQATADLAGRYRFLGLAPGDYTLRALGRGGAPADEQFVLGPSEVRQLDPTLAAAGTLRIRVVNERGHAVPEALLAFQAAGRTVRMAEPPRTDAAGWRVQGELPLGPVALRATAPDGARGQAQAHVVSDREQEIIVRVTRQ